MESNDIQFCATELKTQWEAIAKSRMTALDKIFGKRYSKVTGLDENDPQELFRFAVGFTEQPPDLTQDKTAQKFAEEFQRVDPQFAGSPETEQLFRKWLGTPTLRETTLALANRSQDDAELAGWLTKLVGMYHRGRIAQAELETSNYDKTTALLLLNWLIEPLDFIHSLAFFSDLAMAKRVYWLQHHKLLPPERLLQEPERVRKIYCNLGLRPADQRTIKDIKYKAEKFYPVVFKARTPKGR